MTDQQWAGIRQRVEALGASPASNDAFGAVGHRWVLEQPISHAELAPILDYPEARTGLLTVAAQILQAQDRVDFYAELAGPVREHLARF